MTRSEGQREGSSRSRGFSLLELTTYLLLSSLVMGGVVSLFMRQSRHFSAEQELTEARETLRGALALLTSELRYASVSRGDLSEIKPQSFTVRSFVGAGDVCAVHASKEQYALWEPVGDFGKLDKDSALVYNGAAGWVAMEYNKVWYDPAASEVPVCAWPGAPLPGVVVEMKSVGSDVGHVGSGVWHFRSVDYGLIEQDGTWWLGQRVNSDDAKKWEVLTGPVYPPSQHGLRIRYFDETGSETTDPTEVVRVHVTLRPESQGVRARSDSMSTSVFLRD